MKGAADYRHSREGECAVSNALAVGTIPMRRTRPSACRRGEGTLDS
jgi:hypothetical protein